MKELTKDKLEYLLKNIDWIRVDLNDWKYNNKGDLLGYYKSNNFVAIDNDNISVELDLHVVKGEYYRSVELTLKDIWIGEELYQVEDENQIEIITNEIIKNLDF